MAIYNPDGTPHYVRCYDAGDSVCDRYTVCFTGRYRHLTGGEFVYLAMSCAPFHPQGFGQHGEMRSIDRSVLGRKIRFTDLPPDCQLVVRLDCEEESGHESPC